VTDNDPGALLRILDLPVWAVVGLSGSPHRPAYDVSGWLIAQGRRIVPISPQAAASGSFSVHGEQGYASLAEVPFPVDVVDIFRRSDQAGQHVDEAIAVGAKAVWLQLGVVDEAAAERARAAGLLVAMDTCPKIEAPRVGWRPAA
jgi:predicted CoA-binding protein